MECETAINRHERIWAAINDANPEHWEEIIQEGSCRVMRYLAHLTSGTVVMLDTALYRLLAPGVQALCPVES